MDPNTVVKRSPIKVELLKHCVHGNWCYSFTVTLHNGTVKKITGYARDKISATSAALNRSGRMIEKGYQVGM